ANHTYHLNSKKSDLEGLQAKLRTLQLTLDLNPGNPFYDVSSGHHGFIAANEEYIVIAIRGSGEPDDWRNNFRYWQEAYAAGGNVHAGFALAARGIVPAILAELQRAPMRYAKKAVWLTGHSSGGSVAILVAQELARQQIDVAGVYTFGAPKVGDWDYAHAYPLHDKLFAFATLGDLVPLLPPPWLRRVDGHVQLQRYRHVIPPKLLVGKTVSLRSALAHFRNHRAGIVEKIIGALIDFSPHSLVAAYIPNLKDEMALPQLFPIQPDLQQPPAAKTL
ncbi:MAG: lipase family protein, partial [Caldilineaceae bacterium]|nr:lipase family protein [Caldilineaceae bacterium]